MGGMGDVDGELQVWMEWRVWMGFRVYGKIF